MPESNRKLAVLWLICLTSVAASMQQLQAAAEHSGSQIALTFDDAPRGPGPFFTGQERTQQLIAALRAAEVDEVMFFVTTRNIARSGEGADAG